MRKKRIILWVVATAVVFTAVIGIYRYFILDLSARPFCDKQAIIAFRGWALDNSMGVNSNGNSFPNVMGHSLPSMEPVCVYMNYTEWTNIYGYVPGLREGDPGDLVLLYLNRPTRWKWHGGPQTRFNDQKWMFVPVDFTLGDRSIKGRGELSERVSSDEFRERLTRTLDYIRTNDRPHWQTIVAEHQKFLNSIKEVDR